LRFAVDEFDAAGRAAGFAPTGMQLVDFRRIGERENQPLVLGDFKLSNTFNSQHGHAMAPGYECYRRLIVRCPTFSRKQVLPDRVRTFVRQRLWTASWEK
jgi:hypothetical protein